MQLFIFLAMAWAASAVAASPDSAQFNDKGELTFPSDYREWIYLSTGLGMTYGPAASAGLDNPSFDNVYVNPSSWKAFKETGAWPEGTIFVLEIRFSTSQGSINKAGYFQTDIAAIEASVKDTKRFPRGWGYYGFGGGLRPVRQTSTPLGVNAGCNACHEANAAVENSFAQFYPTALAIAEKKGVLKASFHLPGSAASPARMLHSIEGLAEADIPKTLDEAMVANPSAVALREASLNGMGYALVQAGKPGPAVSLFEWVCKAYPNSANAADSLAEAYETAGRPGPALVAARRTLELLDKDSSVAAARREALQKAGAERIERLERKAK